MDILDLLSQLKSNTALDYISNATGVSAQNVGKVVELGLPTLLQAMGNNTKTESGALSLSNALDTHHAETQVEGINSNDGANILRHILGTKRSGVESGIASSVGIEPTQVRGILSYVAPLLMSFLGQQKQSQNLDATGIASMLPALLGTLGKGGSDTIMAQVTSLLDSNKDGNIMDDVSKFFGGLFKKK